MEDGVFEALNAKFDVSHSKMLEKIRSQAFRGFHASTINFQKGWSSLKRRGEVCGGIISV